MHCFGDFASDACLHSHSLSECPFQVLRMGSPHSQPTCVLLKSKPSRSQPPLGGLLLQQAVHGEAARAHRLQQDQAARHAQVGQEVRADMRLVVPVVEGLGFKVISCSQLARFFHFKRGLVCTFTVFQTSRPQPMMAVP